MNDKKILAMDLFIESVLEPDNNLRSEAKSLKCFDELMEIRKDMLEYLYTIRSNYGTIKKCKRGTCGC